MERRHKKYAINLGIDCHDISWKLQPFSLYHRLEIIWSINTKTHELITLDQHWEVESSVQTKFTAENPCFMFDAVRPKTNVLNKVAVLGNCFNEPCLAKHC